ncbi:MAG: thiamine ABC transporter substrate binding subunit [Alphaproteobacteria bacterium]
MRKALILAAVFWLGLAPARAEKLVVYTYDSFVAEWGPGPKIKSAFEARCGCELEFVGLADGVAILNRLRFEGARARADIALGLDASLIAQARDSGLFVAHGIDTTGLSVPGGWSNEAFVPFDFGYFAFVYDQTRLANPPASLAELVNSGTQSIIIQDPRTSTPGLGLVLWMRAVFGEKAGQAWAKLAPRIVTVTKGWSQAYGLFLKGEADMVLSYTTSPAYHQSVEQVTKYRAAGFAEGHYRQIEIAGLLKAAKHPALARRFLAFLLSRQAQNILPATQWMYPVRAQGVALPPAFDTLVKVKKSLSIPPDVLRQNRRAWVAEWRDALSQ